MGKGIKDGKLTLENAEITFLDQEKGNRAKELLIAYKEIAFLIEERGKRAAELAVANLELIFENEEKEKREAELIIANRKLAFQNQEKEKRVTELAIANRELRKAEYALRKLNEELEQKVKKRSSQYAFISQVNQTIVHVKDAETLFRKVCRIALDCGQFKMAWMGRFDLTQKITILDSCGIPSEDIKLFTRAPYVNNDLQDSVLRTGEYFLCNDIENTPELESWKPYAAKHNIRSGIVLPIKKSGKVFGTFNLYATELNFFNEEDITLLIEVTGDISFALDLFEKAEKHREAEETIIKNENRFRALIERSTDMKALATLDRKLFYASPSISEILGYTLEDFRDTPATDIIHPDDISRAFEDVKNILQTEGSSTYSRHRLKHKNGNYIWCEGTVTNLLHEPHVNAIVCNFRDISEKKAIEDQQEFDRNNLNALINNTNDLMWSVDRNFNLITSNLPFDKACEVNSGKAIVKGECVLSAANTPEKMIRFKQLYERAFAGESFTEIEHATFPVELWTQTSYYPIRKGDNIIGTACHSQDITGIKNNELQLRKSEVFNRGVLNSLTSNISVIDASGDIVAVNESWKTFARENGDTKLQRTAEGANYFSVCNKAAEAGDEIAHKVLVGMQSVMDEKNKDFYLEYPCHAPDKQRWFGMRAIKFNSDVPMVVVAHTDITERKFAAQTLIQSEARLREAQALTHISNWEINLVSNTRIWSDKLYKIFGIRREDIKPSHDVFLSMIHPDDYSFVKACAEKSFQTFVAGFFNAKIKRKNGDIRHVYSEWKFEFDEGKKPIRIYGILQDITDRKVAEEEREKLINDTIQRNHDLEQFTFIISHNLRAPAANIIGLAEILQDETLTPQEQKEFLQGLTTSISGLDTVIKDINAILQVKREVNEIKELISFSKLVSNVSTSIGNLIAKHHVRIKSDFSEVDEFYSIKVYLHSIFYNLINNSIKYSKPDEEPRIEIKSKKENGKIILTFKDNGLGFDMKTQAGKIFGLYNRFHSHVEGKGMGLFMVKTQVESIGGKITVASELNKGTEFTIVFKN